MIGRKLGELARQEEQIHRQRQSGPAHEAEMPAPTPQF